MASRVSPDFRLPGKRGPAASQRGACPPFSLSHQSRVLPVFWSRNAHSPIRRFLDPSSVAIPAASMCLNLATPRAPVEPVTSDPNPSLRDRMGGDFPSRGERSVRGEASAASERRHRKVSGHKHIPRSRAALKDHMKGRREQADNRAEPPTVSSTCGTSPTAAGLPFFALPRAWCD